MIFDTNLYCKQLMINTCQSIDLFTIFMNTKYISFSATYLFIVNTP